MRAESYSLGGMSSRVTGIIRGPRDSGADKPHFGSARTDPLSHEAEYDWLHSVQRKGQPQAEGGLTTPFVGGVMARLRRVRKMMFQADQMSVSVQLDPRPS